MIVPQNTQPIAIPGSRVKVALGAGNLTHLGKIVRGCGCGSGNARAAGERFGRGGGGARRAGRWPLHKRRRRWPWKRSAMPRRIPPRTMSKRAAFARGRGISFIVGLGGGSAMDCAKGINFVLTGGGRMQDYWGVGLARGPMLPMVAVPTTAGTGSEAQSFALITDPQTHQKMACGDGRALPRVAILDPELTATQPAMVATAAGIDAIAHVVETCASTRRNEASRGFSRAAWALLESAYETAMRDPADVDARQRMLLGAHLAGVAIENSMLGARTRWPMR